MGSAEAGQQKGYGLYLYRIMKIPGRYLLSEESGYLFFGAGEALDMSKGLPGMCV